MIEQTREMVQNKYTVANGFEHDAQVIYGDTDSVMIKFGNTDMAQVMKIAEEAAAYARLLLFFNSVDHTSSRCHIQSLT
jgi:DNA polymerase delta subunit 1